MFVFCQNDTIQQYTRFENQMESIYPNVEIKANAYFTQLCSLLREKACDIPLLCIQPIWGYDLTFRGNYPDAQFLARYVQQFGTSFQLKKHDRQQSGIVCIYYIDENGSGRASVLIFRSSGCGSQKISSCSKSIYLQLCQNSPHATIS